MSEEKYKKISDSEFQLEINNKYETIKMPFGKVEALLKCFAGNGGLIDPETGIVKTDLLTLVSQFGELGTIALSTFNEDGEMTEKRSCKGLSHKDVINLFMFIQDVIQGFIQAISETQTEVAESQKEKAKKKTTKTE